MSDLSNLDPALVEKMTALDKQYNPVQQQLTALEDIANMTQEVVNILDDQKKDKKVENLGVLLTDIRESLSVLKDKEDPEAPDYAKPVVEAVSRLEKELTKSISKIDIKPQIKVDAPAVNVAPPAVNVAPPNVDLRGMEKALGKLPKAFAEAIKLIPKTEIPEQDFTPLLSAWEGISEQLQSIETASRLKPQFPNQLKVVNPDGSVIGHGVATTPTVTSVSVTNTNTSILAANASRVGATITNEGTATCYLKLGSTATTTSYALQIASGGYYEVPFGYIGAIDGITSASTAQLRVTELV